MGGEGDATEAGRLRGLELDASALLDTLFDKAPVGLAFWDTELRYQRINPALAEMNGLTPEAHLGHTVEEVLGELGTALSDMFHRILATGEPELEVEFSGETPAAPGVERQWIGSYYPVDGRDGTRIGVGALVREITAERVAQIRNVELTQDALQARAQAEAAQLRAEAARAEAQAARLQTEFLARAGARMGSSMDYEKTLRTVAGAAVPVIADWCAVTMLDPNGQLRTVAVAHEDPAKERLAWELNERYPTDPDSPVGVPAVLRSGERELIEDIPDELLEAAAADPEHLALLRALELRSSLTVPLKTLDRTLGAITLILAESGRRFGRETVSLAEALAARAGLAVENARLYTERSHIARTLQDSLRPAHLPDIPGIDLAARYRASGEQNEVGGDFYDVFSADEGAWTVLIGDVSGKGPEAAAVTSLTRHTLWTAALLEQSPAANLRLLNDALLGHAEAHSRFCTVIYARVCPSDGEAVVTLSNGGHLPPLLLRPDGQVETIEVSGTLVGAIPDPEFCESTVRLAPGELLLLYTDGVTEVSTTDLELGERKLRETLAQCAGCTADEVVAAAERMAIDLQTGEPRDDMALLALRVDPAART